MSAHGRLCCKSLFALVIKSSPSCRRDFRVKMWGTSSPDDKLTGDLGNMIETTRLAVVGWFVLWREIYHRAILDFCNTIGTKRTFYMCRRMSVLGGKAVVQRTSPQNPKRSSGPFIGLAYRP